MVACLLRPISHEFAGCRRITWRRLDPRSFPSCVVCQELHSVLHDAQGTFRPGWKYGTV
jgi:hypothetical protein